MAKASANVTSVRLKLHNNQHHDHDYHPHYPTPASAPPHHHSPDSEPISSEWQKLAQEELQEKEEWRERDIQVSFIMNMVMMIIIIIIIIINIIIIIINIQHHHHQDEEWKERDIQVPFIIIMNAVTNTRRWRMKGILNFMIFKSVLKLRICSTFSGSSRNGGGGGGVDVLHLRPGDH